MNLVSINEIPDCTEGSSLKEVIVDSPIEVGFLDHLKGYGKLRFYPDFARPFYNAELGQVIKLKGILGNSYFRITLLQDLSQAEVLLRQIVADYTRNTMQKEKKE